MIQKLLKQCCGFSLVEVSIAVAILSLGTTLVGGAIFQVLSIQRFWEDDRIATKETRHAASWVSGDALEATATDLVDGAQGVETTTLTLDSGAVTYSLAGSKLIRQAGAAQNTIASSVVSVNFSLAGQLMTMALEVTGSRGTTETLTQHTYLRLLD